MLDTFLVVTTILALVYAHYSYRQGVRAPILKMSLYNPDKHERVEFETNPRSDTIIGVTKSDFLGSLEAPSLSQGTPDLRIPLVLRNTGTKTAKKVRLHIRYSALFSEVLSVGVRIPNSDGTKVIVIEHELPDIHPKLDYLHEGDILRPSRLLFDGLSDEVIAPSKDGIMMKAHYRVRMSAVVEFMLTLKTLNLYFGGALSRLWRHLTMLHLNAGAAELRHVAVV